MILSLLLPAPMLLLLFCCSLVGVNPPIAKITVKDMLQKGIVLNIIAIAMKTIFTASVSPIFLPQSPS